VIALGTPPLRGDIVEVLPQDPSGSEESRLGVIVDVQPWVVVLNEDEDGDRFSGSRSIVVSTPYRMLILGRRAELVNST